MGSGSGPQPQPPEEDRPRDLSDGWRHGDLGSVRLIRGYESDPSSHVDVRRRALAARKLLAGKPVVADAVREIKDRFAPGLAIAARVRLNPTTDQLVIDGLSPAEIDALDELPNQLGGPVGVAAARCKAALPDGRISAEMIHAYIIYELLPEPIADRIATAWLGDRVDVVGLPPEAPEAIQFRLEPGQIAMVFRGASGNDRDAHNTAITALQRSWGYQPIDRGGRPTTDKVDENIALAKVAARLDAIKFPDKMIGHLLGVSEKTAGRHVVVGRDALAKDEGPNWVEKLKEKFPDLRLPKRRSPPRG